MIKNNKSKMILTSFIILLPLAAGLLLWNQLPDPMPTHWGANGEIDGWSSKAFTVFALPAFMLGIHWLAMFATSLDPKNKNITGKPLQLIFWACPVLSVFTSSMMYAAAMGIKVDINLILSILLGLMFIIIGNYLPKCRHNYTMGIKIPWTLHDEANWNATHRIAGPVWVAGGILMLFSAAVPALMLVAIAPMILIPIIYSYIYYKKHQ